MKTPKVPPLLVTIGPQCAGKTTFLRELGNVVDVAIDDVPGVYETVDNETASSFLEGASSGFSSSPSSLSTEINWARSIYGKTLFDRLTAAENTEQMVLFKLFFAPFVVRNGFNFQDAYFQLKQIVKDDGLFQVLMQGIQAIQENKLELSSPGVDLFVSEAIYPHGVRTAAATLRRAFQENPFQMVAWGNTNLAPKMYTAALQAAMEARRPVRFIRWGRELPFQSLESLVYRNIERFLRTGRYIPVETLSSFLSRANNFYTRVPGGVAVASHSVLAGLAGFSLDEYGFISTIPASALSSSKRKQMQMRSGVNSEEEEILREKSIVDETNQPSGEQRLGEDSDTRELKVSENVSNDSPVETLPWSSWKDDNDVLKPVVCSDCGGDEPIGDMNQSLDNVNEAEKESQSANEDRKVSTPWKLNSTSITFGEGSYAAELLMEELLRQEKCDRTTAEKESTHSNDNQVDAVNPAKPFENEASQVGFDYSALSDYIPDMLNLFPSGVGTRDEASESELQRLIQQGELVGDDSLRLGANVSITLPSRKASDAGRLLSLLELEEQEGEVEQSTSASKEIVEAQAMDEASNGGSDRAVRKARGGGAVDNAGSSNRQRTACSTPSKSVFSCVFNCFLSSAETTQRPNR